MMRVAKYALLGALLFVLSGMTPTQRVVLFSGVSCAQSQSFLSRTTGLDGKHQAAYSQLICSLAAAGVLRKLDALYVTATANSATALTNLVSSSFTAVVHGAPTFTADQGYTGVGASTTVYLDTLFNPQTFTTGNYIQNSSHISTWVNTDSGVADTEASIGINDQNTDAESDIFPRHSDGKAYFRINDNASASSAGITVAHSNGFYVANRSAGATQQGYINAVNQGVVSVASAAPNNFPTGTILLLAENTQVGGPANGSGRQHAAFSIGGNLSATDVSIFCHSLNVYLTTINGQAGVC